MSLYQRLWSTREGYAEVRKKRSEKKTWTVIETASEDKYSHDSDAVQASSSRTGKGERKGKKERKKKERW